MKPIHINAAESIIEPFWDPEISTLDQWTIKKEKAERIFVEQTWCMVSFKWTEASKNSKALSFSRKYKNLSVIDSDTLIISSALTNGVLLNINISDGNEDISYVFKCTDDKKHEIQIDISNIDKITKIKIDIGSVSSTSGSGWFNWIGLADSSLLEQLLYSGAIEEDTWQKHLKPVDYKPTYKPSYGILMDDEDIEVLRKMTADIEDDANPLNDFRSNANLSNPEMHKNDFVNFLSDCRYNRERDEGNLILKKGENAAVAGIIQKDPVLLRLAARYALVIASCTNWDDGFICDFQTSSFNHRCFVQSLCLYECALILDLAGEFFTDVGRDYVLRKMAEEGSGVINFNTWKYEYIFHCNQMSWFSPGRMYGYAVLLQHYPRIEPYMDIALNDVIENINNTIEEDGGYLEGPGYFSCVGRDALSALYIYARTKKIDIEELIPSVLQKTADFGEVLESTDQLKDFVQICDSGLRIKSAFINRYKVHLAFMAFFLPNSVWPEIFQKHIDNYGLGNNPLAWLLYNKMQRNSKKKRRALIRLNITGHVSSLRKGIAGDTKILVIGNKAGAGHTHYDKGSFVYEYGGETFLMDPGICSYDNPISWELKFPDRHNMLIPIGGTEITSPENPLMCDVIPIALGNDKNFSASIDLSKTWTKGFLKWKREINSPDPETLIVKDEYLLAQGEGVSMNFSSPLDIRADEKYAYIKGEKGLLVIDIPDRCTVKIDSLPHPVMTQNRLQIFKEGKKGEITVNMRMKQLI